MRHSSVAGRVGGVGAPPARPACAQMTSSGPTPLEARKIAEIQNPCPIHLTLAIDTRFAAAAHADLVVTDG